MTPAFKKKVREAAEEKRWKVRRQRDQGLWVVSIADESVDGGGGVVAADKSKEKAEEAADQAVAVLLNVKED